MKLKIVAALVIFSSLSVFSQSTNKLREIIGSAYLENKSYNLLERLCDEAGGRVIGSEVNEKAMSIMKDELKNIGYEAKFEKFSIPGWVRGNDQVIMKTPTERKLQAVALGYVNKTPAFKANVVYAKYGLEENYKNLNVNDKIVLVTQEAPPGKEQLLRYQALDIAAKHGAKAILYINDRSGFLNLAGMGNFQGNATKIPAFSLTFEEGKWLERLIERNMPVTIEIATNSYCKEINSANIIATLEGKVKSKIVIGAHFDSWDLGQGAVDNGVGTAILFDVARLLKSFSPNNYYSIEFVWFNGEEFGLWGSKKFVEIHKQDSIIAMINMDMTGTPTGFNVMGFDEFIPFFENVKNQLNGFNLNSGVISSPGTNSDHMYFMFDGIPTFEIQAHLDESMYRFYHERGDTFDKVNEKYLSDASAVISVLVEQLSNAVKLNFKRKTSHEMVELFKHYELDKRLKNQGEWIYKEN